MRYFTALCFFILLFSGCATTESNSSRSSRYVIPETEIRNSSAANAYEAIQLLRPELLNRDQLRSADMFSAAEVYVYVNGARYGRKEDLKTIPAGQISSIQYLSPTEATGRYGSDHAGGAFLITLK